MRHFLNYILVYAAMHQFEQFLVVKIAERVQELSRLKCPGCVTVYPLDQLHHCMTVPLKDRIKLFLPRAKDEALARLNNLFHLYHSLYQKACVDYIEGSRAFIAKLTVNHLIDRRYVNEDSVVMYPYNTTWLYEEEDFLVAQIESNMLQDVLNTLPPLPPLSTLPPIAPLDPADEEQKIAPKKRNRKLKTKDCWTWIFDWYF